ncbi:SDR family oxidoreductase [Sphingobium baderi]|uniref:Short-chain dehydrogenase n=1 Tax=Sphingobium baderi LL03 TaxID=1114964 RepID=T0G490_9SPHN|nr:SDR family NAD(P)-dependent oxidoreductase [Sphingobium baderi]EQA98500.1 hypothetical protein L485_17610 [Sphingobium baderi LL03]KMS61682.1 hypothetical protein V475_12835 [Sphingobium baderi LL03]WRD75431.1 SDR family oxidoreductase [Sphingobium baderi]
MSDRIAIVTGSGQGLGEEIAIALAERGYKLALFGRTAAKIERVAARIGGGTLPIALDLTDPDAVRAAFNQVEDRLGALDVLVNNAATYVPFLIADATDEQIRTTIDGSLVSALYCIREAIRRMRPHGSGDIVSISSESVRYPAPLLSVYAAAKAGLAKIHEALRRELHDSGIRPMIFETGRIDSSSAGEHWPPEMVEEFMRRFETLGYSGPLARDAATARTLAATIVHMIESPRDAVFELVQMRAVN